MRPYKIRVLQFQSYMNIPSLEQAKALISEAERLNPGLWVQHSLFVGKAAEAITQYHPRLNPQVAFILGISVVNF